MIIKWLGRHYLLAFCCVAGLWIAYRIISASLEEKAKNKQTILYAAREAPLGGEYIRFLKSGDVEFGGFVLRERASVVARYRLEGDSIRIIYAPMDTINRGNWFRIKGHKLIWDGVGELNIGFNGFDKQTN